MKIKRVLSYKNIMRANVSLIERPACCGFRGIESRIGVLVIILSGLFPSPHAAITAPPKKVKDLLPVPVVGRL